MFRNASDRIGRCAILLFFSALALTEASAATPDPAFRAAERLTLLCQVRLDRLGHEAVAADLCGRIKLIAEQGAPIPVEIIDLGELARASDGAVALLVHASVAPASSVAEGAGGELMTFTMRTLPTGALAAEPAWFGAAPRVVRHADAVALDDALRASLSEVLPWLNRAGRLIPLEKERGS